MKHNKDKTAARTGMPHARGGISARPITPVFDRQRDEYRARQLDDAGKTEAERRAAFKAIRKKGRGSPMIKRQRPVPALKPTPALAAGPDRIAYNDALGRERREARRAALIAEGIAARDDLYAYRRDLKRTEAKLPDLDRRAASGDLKGATREAFKMMRQIEDGSERSFSRANAFLRDARNR